MTHDSFVKRYEVEVVERWIEIIEFIPSLKFPDDWEVKIIPPFGRAVVRFKAKIRDKNQRAISVYLDWYDALGCCGQPYWEAYPIDDNNERWLLADHEKMIAAIDKELRK